MVQYVPFPTSLFFLPCNAIDHTLCGSMQTKCVNAMKPKAAAKDNQCIMEWHVNFRLSVRKKAVKEFKLSDLTLLVWGGVENNF